MKKNISQKTFEKVLHFPAIHSIFNSTTRTAHKTVEQVEKKKLKISVDSENHLRYNKGTDEGHTSLKQLKRGN